MSSDESTSRGKWENVSAHFPIIASDDSVGDPTPDSTFSATEDEFKISRRSTPASSVCGQDGGEPDLSPLAQSHWATDCERATAQPATHGQAPRTPSIVSRFFLGKKLIDLTSPRPVDSPSPKTPHNAVRLPIPSDEKMYPFRGAPCLFVGFEDQVPPPPGAAERWKKDIEPRFWTDASEFQQKLMRTRLGYRHPLGISFELRMSGYAPQPRSTHVDLTPRMWVLYDHDRWKTAVKKFVRELEWLNNEGFGPVEIRKGSPRLATLNPLLMVENLPLLPDHGFTLPEDSCLYLHVEARPGPSAVGRLCCATLTKNGNIRGQRISRIGGIVDINSQRKLAITTAHGMLELVWDSLMGLETEEEDDWDLESSGSLHSSRSSGYESDDSSTSDDATWAEQTWPTIPLGTTPQEVRHWEPVEILGVTSFLGSGHLLPRAAMFGLGALEPPKPDTDFSLWGIPGVDALNNEYASRNEPRDKVLLQYSESVSLTESTMPTSLDLLLGSEQLLQVHLLPGQAQFMVRGVRFTGRKVRTKAPLGLGCSGTWVAHGAYLVGMLIAAYDNEPYAYFIPSDALLRDVGSAIPGSTGVIQEDCLPPSVHLPTAPTHRGEITPVQRQLYSARGAREDANVASSITISEDLPLKSLNEILDEETQSALWPKTPLAMTVAQRGELKAHLEKVSPIVEKAYKALETWYGCTKDVTRARRFIRFKHHVSNQFDGSMRSSSLKTYASITVNELDDGLKLLEGMVKDLATRFPSFLKSHNAPQNAAQQDNTPPSNRKREESLVELPPQKRHKEEPSGDTDPQHSFTPLALPCPNICSETPLSNRKREESLVELPQQKRHKEELSEDTDPQHSFNPLALPYPDICSETPPPVFPPYSNPPDLSESPQPSTVPSSSSSPFVSNMSSSTPASSVLTPFSNPSSTPSSHSTYAGTPGSGQSEPNVELRGYPTPDTDIGWHHGKANDDAPALHGMGDLRGLKRTSNDCYGSLGGGLYGAEDAQTELPQQQSEFDYSSGRWI